VICTGGGDDDVRCGGGRRVGGHQGGGVVSEMRKAVVFRSRYENGNVLDRGGIREARILAGSDVAAAPRLRSNVHLYLPEYRKESLGMKASQPSTR
jgi:hypothetical protein